MFRPMLHGQNRRGDLGINPRSLVSSGYDIFWIDHISGNFSSNPTFIVEYTNIFRRDVKHETRNTGLTYEEPSIVYSDSGFNDKDCGDFNGVNPQADGIFGIDIKSDNYSSSTTLNILESTGSFNDFSAFACLSIINADLQQITPKSIFSFNSYGSGDNLTVSINTYMDGGLYYIEFGIFQGSRLTNYTVQASSQVAGGRSDFIFSATSRSIFINGEKILDVYSLYPLNAQVEVGRAMYFLGMHEDYPIQGIGYFNNSYISEALIYGRRLTDEETIGVHKWLNRKYELY